MRQAPDKSHLNSVKHTAGGQNKIFLFNSLRVLQMSFSLLVLGVPVLMSFKSFSLVKFQEGKVATIMLLLLCYSFLKNYIYIFLYIYPCIYIHTSFLFIISFYFGDTGGIFCSLPVCR